MDGDGDKDAADYKMAVYQAGGMSDKESLEKSRKFNDLDEADGEPRKFARNVMLPSSNQDPVSPSKHKAVQVDVQKILSDPRISDETREELKKLFKL